MTPKPNEDLFIEPAGDSDVIYGDYNSTMDGSVGQAPYLRLISALPNVTRSESGEVRLKCEAAGAPLPIKFESKLVITDLDVLDSGYYQCTVKNSAGSKNTTSVLRVNPLNSNAPGKKLAGNRNKNNKQLSEDFEDEPYDYLDEMTRDEENFAVPDNAAGAGYVPAQSGHLSGGSSDRWLDGKVLRKGDCVLYQGESCGQFLGGRYVKIMSDNHRNLRAAMMFINNMKDVQEKCKRYSHAVACFHLYKVCDRPLTLSSPSAAHYAQSAFSGSSSNSNEVLSICRKDCDDLKNKECPRELALAAQHELVGDGDKALIPNCDSLSLEAPKCIPVFEPTITHPIKVAENTNAASHWCYVGNGINYEGTASTTKSNRQCVPWPQSTSTQFNTITYPNLKFTKNYCRNPEGRRSEPFCYTVSDSYPIVYVEEACGIPECPPNFYPDLRQNQTTSTPPPLMDSLSNVWRSLSSQWQLALVSGISGLGILLLLLLICCCCCRNKSKKQRRKGSNSGLGGTSATTTIIHNLESGSSVISTGKRGQLGLPPNSCNGGGSSMANSDINTAYYRKMREEANRMHGDEALNPLLNYGQQPYQQMPPPHLQQQFHQQQMYEMQQQQQQNFGGWDGYSGIANMPYPPPQQQFHPQQLLGGQQHGYMQQSNGNIPYNTNNSPHTSTEPPAEPFQISTIQEEHLKFEKKIGEDATTVLYLGELIGEMISGASLKVAIKTMKPNVPQIAIENFREEIKEAGPFEHLNVLRTIGVSYLKKQNISVVFDYSVHGDLHDFLKVREPRNGSENDERERVRIAEDFLRICTQIASGMDYLVSNSYVHRDLAARNCLVGDQQNIKIADFGRMKACYDQDYYNLNGTRIPLRWLSKEAFTEGRYSHASDVYAFGVTLWEIYTYGKQPYVGYSNEEVINMLTNDVPLDIPSFCPPIIYGVMIECWHQNPKRRPSFQELHGRFLKWASSGQVQALFSTNQQQRASSVHSGASAGSGSGTQRGTGRQIGGIGSSGASSQQMIRGSMGGLLEQFGSNGLVPSPAPNSTVNLSAGNTLAGGGAGQIAKLTMLGNGASIVHSTPKGNRSPPRVLAPLIPTNGEQSPLMNQRDQQHRNNGNHFHKYSDDDYSDEEDSS